MTDKDVADLTRELRKLRGAILQLVETVALVGMGQIADTCSDVHRSLSMNRIEAVAEMMEIRQGD